MPRIDIDLSGFTQARTELDRLALRQRAAEARIASAKIALDAAVRSGASAEERRALSARVASAQAARGALVTERRTLQNRMDELANGLVRNRDPSTLVGALDGHIPIALLPMRIETRYLRVPRQPVRLRIRIYPDDLNTIDHEPTPTADEQQSAMAYWRARFAHDDDEAARILRDLTRFYGRGRALWLVRVHTPTNPVPAPDAEGEPAFPPTDVIDALAKATRAVLLPERWCAIGYAAGRREVFRVWGNTIPDELVLSPGLARDRRPRGAARWRSRVDGRLRRGAQERHGHRSDTGQDRAAAAECSGRPLRSCHRHARAAGRRRLRVDEERRRQRRRLHRPPGRASGFERPGLRGAGHADQQHGGRAGGLQPEFEQPASASRSGQQQGRPGRAAAPAVGVRHRARGAARRQHRESRISRTSAPVCT